MTYYVVFASDVHDIICVAVPASDPETAKREVLNAVGFWADTMVFEQPPLAAESVVWSLDYLMHTFGDR